MRHPGRDKSANVVRKCAVSEVDETQELKPLTWIPEMSLRALNAKMKRDMKHAVVMVLCGSCDRTLHGFGSLGTSVGTTEYLHPQRRNCRFRPRSQQTFQNNGAHLPDSTASHRKPLRFSRSPPGKLEFSRPTSYVFNQTSLK